MTFVEVLVSLFLTIIVLLGLLSFTNAAYSSGKRNMDKQFGTQKAISMLEELKSLVQVPGNTASTLDAYDDGTAYKTVLTTDTTITNPNNAISSNVALPGGSWKYLRQISVTLLPGSDDSSVRLVNVRICLNVDNDSNGQPDTLAEVAGVIRTLADDFPPTQVYDVYALAVENVPGWWVYMANLIPFMQNSLQDLQSRNPGMEFRVHWIRELAYGRDRLYRPYINDTVDSEQDINYVYFYPGRMPAGEAVNYYYPPNNFNGHILVDGTDTNGYDARNNPFPYALADMYNHAMRYPDELALFNQRVTSGQEVDDAPTLRILLERLYRNPEQFVNAIFINLHGELFPFPPVRNYSDPAKEPENMPKLRAVTHPERLRYDTSSSSVRLRVYSYRMDPDNTTASSNRDWLGQNLGGNVPITVTLKGITWTPAAGEIQAIKGGTDQDGTPGPDAYQVVNATTTVSASEMYYTVTQTGGDTIISLYNSPLKAPEVNVAGSSYTGLRSSMRLYGLEYLPAPSEDFTGSTPPTPFTTTLATTHTVSWGNCTAGACAPNTARWVVSVPATVLPGGSGGNYMMTVETRVDSTTSGVPGDEIPNLSRTYVWRGSGTWAFGDGTPTNPPNLPITEQYQIIGDPRHNPYADLKMPHSGSGKPAADPLGMGYNRYFDDFQNSSYNMASSPNWPGYVYTASGQSYGIKNDGNNTNDGWKGAGGYVELDMHRIYEMMRTMFVKARTIYTTMTGYSYYYCGIGGEIGYDSANGFANSIPISTKPFTGSSGTGFEQSILPGSGDGVKYIRENTGGSYWWGINWLGELYPDSAYTGGSGWVSIGNLPTGTGSGNFIRTLRDSINVDLPRGTSLEKAGRRTGPEGSTSFYWTGTASSTFHHIPSGGTGDLQTGGNEIAARYNYPLSNGIPINRPFDYDVNNTGANPDHFLQPSYGSVYTAGYLSQFYDHSVQTSSEGSALMSLTGTGNDVQFVVVNGISTAGLSGTSFVAHWSMLTLMHGFFASGRYNPSNSYLNHVEQLPRVSITSPNSSTNLNNPSTVPIGWTREWLRWDGQKYTPGYPSNYAETSALSYTVLYSPDNGSSWHYMQDDSAATPGVRPSSSSLLISTASATPTYTWSTPAGSFPRGKYLIRVEAYRDNLPLHYSYHQYPAFIRRP